jgi:hypothetical protein
LAIPPAPFCDGFFRARVSRSICLGWLPTPILLISTFWVGRIIGVSYWCPAFADILRFPEDPTSVEPTAKWFVEFQAHRNVMRHVCHLKLLSVLGICFHQFVQKWLLSKNQIQSIVGKPYQEGKQKVLL